MLESDYLQAMSNVGKVPLWEGLWKGSKGGKRSENLLAHSQPRTAVAVVTQVAHCIPL